jgi:hypothetical protein
MPRRRKDPSWCVLDTSKPEPALLCKNCGGNWGLPLPIRIDAAVFLLRAFAAQHRFCPPPQEIPSA